MVDGGYGPGRADSRDTAVAGGEGEGACHSSWSADIVCCSPVPGILALRVAFRLLAAEQSAWSRQARLRLGPT